MSEDLIKRDDAIEAIEETDWYHQNCNKDMVSGANDDEHQAWYKSQDVYKALENVPSADKWIPCSERLPKAEEKVWIQTERGKVCFAMYEDGTISEDDSAWNWYDLPFDKWDEENDCGIIPEGWWEWTEFHPDTEFDCPIDEVVVAWMSLPELMKGAEDE